MKQMSLNSVNFECRTKWKRNREFLAEMNLVVHWSELVALIEQHTPTPGSIGGRPPFAAETMLRIHFLQRSFTLSNPAMEETLYDTLMFREFAGLDIGEDHLPDESTFLRFRHLLEAHELSAQILLAVNAMLEAKGLLLKSGTAVDSTLIAAPSPTKHKDGKRDPELHQTKKGNQWHFWIKKAHIGADAESELVHTMVATAANVNDVTQALALLHGEESDVFGHSGYQGVQKREETQGMYDWHVFMRPVKRKALDKGTPIDAIMVKLEKTMASIRAIEEHPFRVLKRQFGHVKVCYVGLAKNTAQLHTLFALANLWTVRRRLLKEMRE
jgi:transposase, IS5 family